MRCPHSVVPLGRRMFILVEAIRRTCHAVPNIASISSIALHDLCMGLPIAPSAALFGGEQTHAGYAPTLPPVWPLSEHCPEQARPSAAMGHTTATAAHPSTWMGR